MLYLKYPAKFPKSNVPTKIAEKGAIGVKVDESVDSVRAGVGDIIQGWDLGISQACQGERRKIMMSSEMAYGQAGAFRVIPPQVSKGNTFFFTNFRYQSKQFLHLFDWWGLSQIMFC